MLDIKPHCMTTQMNAIFAVLVLVLFGFVSFFNILSKKVIIFDIEHSWE